MTPHSDATAPLYSSLASDPDLADIVEMFVEEMPDRISAILTQCEAGEWEMLRRTAHQIKGAAGSYGFESVSPVAGRLEDTIRAGEPEDRIRQAVASLVDLCQSCRAGDGN